jgi:hypothetical protein
MSNLRKAAIQLAFDNPGPVQDALLPLLIKQGSGDGIHDLRLHPLRKAVTSEDYDLAYAIYTHLYKIYEGGVTTAFNRLSTSIHYGESWDQAQHHENLTAAAKALGIH